MTRSVDPRVGRSRTVILRAALEELSAVGYGAWTIESVAARAGVGKSTIYRHWTGKPGLVADALRELNRQPRPDPATASPRERVTEIVRHFAEAMRDPLLSGCLAALVAAAEHDPELRALHHRYCTQRREALVAALAAVPGGPAPEPAAVALVGAVLYRRVMTGQPFDPDGVPELVDLIIGRSAPG